MNDLSDNYTSTLASFKEPESMTEQHHDDQNEHFDHNQNKRKSDEISNGNNSNNNNMETTTDSSLDIASPSSNTTPARWYPSSIIIEASTFDGTTVNADLMNVIGRGVKSNKSTLCERFYLPSQYNQNNAEYRAKTIAPIFASACACAGCEVRLKGWEKSKGFLKFVCPQYRRYKSNAKQQQQQQHQHVLQQQHQPPPQTHFLGRDMVTGTGDVETTNLLEDSILSPEVPNTNGSVSGGGGRKNKVNRSISRPLDKESTCPFSFLVFWEEYAGQEGIPPDSRRGRWFVCPTGAGTPYHEGHSRKEFSEGELRRKQLQVEGAYDILMPFYKKVVELVDRDEEKLNQAIGRLVGLIDGLKRQAIQSDQVSPPPPHQADYLSQQQQQLIPARRQLTQDHEPQFHATQPMHSPPGHPLHHPQQQQQLQHPSVPNSLSPPPNMQDVEHQLKDEQIIHVATHEHQQEPLQPHLQPQEEHHDHHHHDEAVENGHEHHSPHLQHHHNDVVIQTNGGSPGVDTAALLDQAVANEDLVTLI